MKVSTGLIALSGCLVTIITVAPPLFAANKHCSAEDGVTALLTMQCDAWNRGDLDSFMTGYLDSPDTSYSSGGVEVWGYTALRDRYQHRYGASRDTMGKLSFSDLKIFPLGRRYALCLGHWHLDRSDQPAIDGAYSLVLRRSKHGWKIMHDHTSVIEKKDGKQ